MNCFRYLAFAALVLGQHLFSQPYFSRIYPDFRLTCAAVAPDSGLVLGGPGNWLLRVDRYGTPLWTTAYTTSQAEPVQIHDVALIGDSSYILVGTAGTTWTPSNKMVQQVVGSTGQVLWGGEENGGGFYDTNYWLGRAERAPDGSVIMCGARLTMLLGMVSGNSYAARIGETGSYFTPFVSFGSNLPKANILDVAATSDGGFVGVGFGGFCAIAYKVSAVGTVVWTRSLPECGVDGLPMHVVDGESGSTYVTTEAFSGYVRLMRIDSTGTVSWSKKYQVPDGWNLKPTGLVRFPNGDLWISGRSWLMACTSVGSLLWARSVPHTIVDMEIVPENDGVFLIGREGNDGWLMRTDVNGEVPDCAEPSFVPPMIAETVVSTPVTPPSPSAGLSSYQVNAVSGVVPVTLTDCVSTDSPLISADERRLSVYPMPFSDHLTMVYEGAYDQVVLIDARGNVCRELSTRSEPSIVLVREDLAPGLYLLRVLNTGRQVAVHPVIAE